MKKLCLKTLIVFTFLFCMNIIQAQTPLTQADQVCLANTQLFSIVSEYVKGESYSIQVGLPIGYYSNQKSHPVLYVLDGDKSFGMTKEITDWLVWNNEIREIIVVAISYGKGTDEWWQRRARDYTHCDDTALAKGWFQETGGADNFIKFIRHELIPAINKNYKTIQDSTAIMGISFGGMLNSYILFTQPEMFDGYIIIAPSLVWSDRSILKLEKEYFDNHKELNKTVYIAYGSLDDKLWITNPTDEFIKMIKTHNYEGLTLSPQIFEGETHISVYSTAITNGLKTIFKR